MHMHDPGPAPEPCRHQLDLAGEGGGIGAFRALVPGHGGMAATIKAEPVAEGHMQVERQRRRLRQGLQPAPIRLGVNARVEMRRGGITGIAGDAPVITGDQFGVGDHGRGSIAGAGQRCLDAGQPGRKSGTER
jgi:hypothetical protein